MSFSNEKVNTHGKKLLRPVRSCSMERAPRHYSTMTIIVQRIWVPQRVFIIVCFSSNLSNLLLSSFHPTIPEIAFHFSLCYTTVFRGKGNFISNSCLSPWPRNSCKYWVICLTSRVTVFVTVLDSKPSDKHDTTSLSCHSPHFEAQRPLQAPVNANTQATPSKHISKHMPQCWIPPSWKRDHEQEDTGFLLVCFFGLFCPRSFRMGETIVSPIVKFHLIFPYDVVSSPHSACQKHLRELLTGKIETHPCRVSCQDGGFRKGLVTQE